MPAFPVSLHTTSGRMVGSASGRGAAWSATTLTLTLLAALTEHFVGKFSYNNGLFSLNDPFHQGEYFAVSKSLAAAPPAHQVISIHGALDFLPNLLSTAVAGPDHHFVATFGLYALLGALAVLLLSALNLYVSTSARQQCAVLCLSLIGTLAVSYRDLLLLASLALFYCLRAGQQRAAWRPVLPIAFGVVTALGQHWSFDRGIAATISLGTATLYLAWRDRRYLVSLISYGATLLAIDLAQDTVSLGALIENVLILRNTSAQWRYPTNLYFGILIGFAWLINVLAVAAFWLSHVSARSIKEHADEAIALTLLAGLLLMIGTNRADLQHIHYALWVPGLLILRMNPTPFPARGMLIRASIGALIIGLFVGLKYGSYGAPLIAACLYHALYAPQPPEQRRLVAGFLYGAAAITLGMLLQRGHTGMRDGSYAWVRALPAQQSNWESAEPAMQWIAAELMRVEAPCVFDLANNGVINGLSKLPACSRFTYPVYATQAFESALIQDLKRANPPALVYSSTYWSYRIDGRSMKARFPKLDEFIVRTYGSEKCDKGYCLRYRSERLRNP
jgi:hypothetical protein